MTDYRTMFDKENLGAWDLAGQDRVVTIEDVKPGKVGRDKNATRKPIITFVGKRKKFPCNITNANTIASLYGPHVEKWKGQKVTLYPTTTTFGRDTVDCIRVRPVKPGASQSDTNDDLDRPVDDEMRARQEAAREAADHG